jgi:hypothetical protein
MGLQLGLLANGPGDIEVSNTEIRVAVEASVF